MNFKLISLLSFILVAMVKAGTCPHDKDSKDCGECIPAGNNPDNGKNWVIGNAGGANNSGGGGLEGEKCEELHPHCEICDTGFKSCLTCKDLTDLGGFKFINVNGVCVLVVDFDTVTTSKSYALIPQGYRGMGWENFFVIHQDYHPNTGYDFGVTSGEYTGFNGWGRPCEFFAPDDSTFGLFGMQATSAWIEGNVITIEGYLDHVKVATESVVLTTLGPTEILFEPEFKIIDEVRISTSAWQVAIDDVLIRIN